MVGLFNIYCDESCHQEHDHHTAMALGALSIPLSNVRGFVDEVKRVKNEYGLSKSFEIKWGKVSPGGLAFYQELLNVFFKIAPVGFRALIIKRKDSLDHERYKQTHDDWYYKMYYQLLLPIIDKNNRYNIYCDYKDTWSAKKLRVVNEYLNNTFKSSGCQPIEIIQAVRSKEVIPVQIVDFLTGAVSYINRGLSTSEAKTRLIEEIQKRSKIDLTRTTPRGEKKINIFCWEPDFRV